jgi:hypothetical protein
VFLRYLIQDVFSWNPTGEKARYSPACDPELWGARLQDPRLNSVQLQGALVQKYFQDCAGELKTGRNSSFINAMKMMSMQFDPQHHPFLHRVVFHLPGNIHLKGLLALKGDYKKRPFIVLRLGIFSSVEEFLPERYLLMQLFEQGPFNVLVVENMSSPDFIADNSRFSFGGYDEGLQNILIARLLRDPHEPLSQLVDTLHFAGVSLGGHGVLYSSLLNEVNDRGRLIQSFMGFCPVVNLKPTMIALTSEGLKGRLANWWGAQRLNGLREKVPALADVGVFRFLPAVMEYLDRVYAGGLSYISAIHLPGAEKDSPRFWKMNEFWDDYDNVKAPVMIWATEQDPAVPFHINSFLLKKKNIKVVSFDEGIHCTLPIPYHWDALSTLIQSYFLSHSPGFKLSEEKMQMDVSDEKIEGEGVLPFRVSWSKGKDRIVNLEIGGFHLSLPIAGFDFRFLNDTLSESEKRMLERWLHQNVKIELEKHEQKKILKISWKKAA